MEIYKEYDSMYILETNDKKTHHFGFMAVFMSYCPHFWGCRGDLHAHSTQYMFGRHDQKLIVFEF
jgi:hypothetical protein